VSHWHPTSIDFDRSAKVVQGRMESLLQLVLEQLNVLMEKGFFFSLFFLVPGLALRAYILSHSTSPIFVLGIFEIGSCELFAGAGFEP
jgi:hypothetical protein